MNKTLIPLCKDSNHDFEYLASDINTIDTSYVICEKCGLTEFSEMCCFDIRQ